MKIKPIRNTKNYEDALMRIDQLIASEPKAGTPGYDELDIISTLVDDYENTHFPIEAPDPVAAIKYIMEEKGLNQQDLVRYFGGNKGLVSAVLNRKRELSKRIIKSLHEGLGIPYEILMVGSKIRI